MNFMSNIVKLVYKIQHKGYFRNPERNLPSLLREITDPPNQLFILRFTSSENHTFCVLWDHKATHYGTHVYKELIAGLKGTEVVIVSGLALGIDSIAHEAAPDAGLKNYRRSWFWV